MESLARDPSECMRWAAWPSELSFDTGNQSVLAAARWLACPLADPLPKTQAAGPLARPLDAPARCTPACGPAVATRIWRERSSYVLTHGHPTPERSQTNPWIRDVARRPPCNEPSNPIRHNSTCRRMPKSTNPTGVAGGGLADKLEPMREGEGAEGSGFAERE